MKTVTERIPSWIRWIVFLPISMFATYLVGGLVHLVFSNGGPIAYVGAFVAGIAYVCVALIVARTIAPSHKNIVCLVLGLFIIGDKVATYLMMNSALFSESFEPENSELSVLFQMLRVSDFDDITLGSLVKVAGVVFGGLTMLIFYLRKRDQARQDS